MSESKVRADAEEPFLANMPLRVLFVPFGSEGDVNPLLWLAEGDGRARTLTDVHDYAALWTPR
jgi:hypothetical protein